MPIQGPKKIAPKSALLMKPAPPATPTDPPPPAELTPKQQAIRDRLASLAADVTLLTDGSHFITVPTPTYNAHRQGYTDIGYIAVKLA